MRLENNYGFSLIELLVVVAIIGVLAAVGVTQYQEYIYESKVATLKNQHEMIVRKVNMEVELLNSGMDSTMQHHSGTRLLRPDDTCLDMVKSIKEDFSGFQNVFDDSDAITLWAGHRNQQKRGKISLRCYKYQDWTASPSPQAYNGGDCPANLSGFRIDTFLVDCGNNCEKSSCSIAGKECSGTGTGVQTENSSKRIYSNQELNVKFGKGNLVSNTSAAQECGLSPANSTTLNANSSVAKEADY